MPKHKGNLLYAFDAGNGGCKGVSSENESIVSFETVLAPISSKRGLSASEEIPDYSLVVDGTTYVFGVDDVFKHGRRQSIRRLNSVDRYLSPDYFHMMKVLFLHAFNNYRGVAERISPTGIISLPISEFNKPEVKDEIKAALCKPHNIVDYNGCELRLDIDAKRLEIVPESTGALFHWAFDPRTLKSRPGVDTTGTTLMIDVGYETCDCSLFENMKYQRDRGFTIPRAGIGNIARRIQDHARTVLRDADVSRIDRGMRKLVNKKAGAKKELEVTPGVSIDVTQVYDEEVEQLSARIADEIRTFYTEEPSHVVQAGGGLYHLFPYLKDHLTFKAALQSVPEPEFANIIGSYSMLLFKSQQAKK